MFNHPYIPLSLSLWYDWSEDCVIKSLYQSLNEIYHFECISANGTINQDKTYEIIAYKSESTPTFNLYSALL